MAYRYNLVSTVTEWIIYFLFLCTKRSFLIFAFTIYFSVGRIGEWRQAFAAMKCDVTHAMCFDAILWLVPCVSLSLSLSLHAWQKYKVENKKFIWLLEFLSRSLSRKYNVIYAHVTFCSCVFVCVCVPSVCSFERYTISINLKCNCQRMDGEIS